MNPTTENAPICPSCDGPLGGRWGNRCYRCRPSPANRKLGENRECATCGQTFYVPRWKLQDTKRRQGTYCSKLCLHESMRLNGEDNSRWARRIFAAYGVTVAEYEEMERRQDGVCAICGGPPNGPGSRLHVDHCHDSDRVRGLLCGRCNTAIGLLAEDPERFARAVKYLKEE